ncbi:lysophospholipid acyltransferase family protein [Patulibacter sp. NPDC049589]|uniref:lysophospholipid acyltransferase family protein n=1 Tax=Patulibacter sp. NPDC049589 TaxID=3154731 RepID=UPI003430F3E2
MVKQGRVAQTRSCAELDERWARSAPARAARALILGGFFEPVLAWYTARTVHGTEALRAIDGPVVLVANHASHIDTPLILRALPGARRRRTAVAAAADYFYADRRSASLVSLAFNTVPVRRAGGGTDDLAHVHELLAGGWSLLMYPEGTRTGGGPGPDQGRMRTGAAVLAAQHGLPVVPVHLSGTKTAMPPGQVWPRRRIGQDRHPVRIAFGAPIRPGDADDRHDTIERVQAFFATQDATLAPGAPVPAPEPVCAR